MELQFLGSGSAFYPQLGSTAAYFVQQNNLYIIDCGESVFEKLLGCEDLDRLDQIYVHLTHLHADHVGSLGSFISYYYCVLKKRLHVIHPVDTIVQLLDLLGIERTFYHYSKELQADAQCVSFTPISVTHVGNMESFGYIIADEQTCIYYSGDASSIPEEIISKLETGEIARIYQDVCSYASDHPTHLYIGELEQLIQPSLRHKVYCMHLDKLYKEHLLGKGFQIVKATGGYSTF